MIGELVELELRALGAEPDGRRVAVIGPEVALPNRSVQILALGLHELATNARKHGALGSPQGKLAVQWSVTGDAAERRLTLDWVESDIDWSRSTGKNQSCGIGTHADRAVPTLSARRADAARYWARRRAMRRDDGGRLDRCGTQR